MSRFRSTSWSHRVDLSPADKLHLRNYITAERNYFNALITSINGPIRTMPETLKGLTNRWEEVLGLVASTRTDLRSLKVSAPGAFAPFADLLFETNGRSKVDSRTQVFMDIVAQDGGVIAEVRRNMAIEVIRYAREQAEALSSGINREDQVFKFAVQTLVPLDAVTKRHVQLPRSAVKVDSVDDAGVKSIRIAIPYIGAAITMPEPPMQWNYLLLREESDGRHTLELSQESGARYLLKKSDLMHARKRPKAGARA